jgi:hypothetical protein
VFSTSDKCAVRKVNGCNTQIFTAAWPVKRDRNDNEIGRARKLQRVRFQRANGKARCCARLHTGAIAGIDLKTIHQNEKSDADCRSR